MKTFREFILKCELVEGKVEWDNPDRPLPSGFTPREKNRTRRIATGVEDTSRPSFYEGGPGEKEYSRYANLKAAHDKEKDKKVPANKRHKFKKGKYTGKTRGQENRRMKTHRIGSSNANDEIRKDRYDYDLKEPKESFNYVEEGKVEWDNPDRPLQSGWTPREKNRARRIKTGVENPDKPSFSPGGPSERDYERYGNLKAAHDTEKDKKVPDEKRHKFKSVTNRLLGGDGKHSAGRIRRMAGVHKGAEIGKNAEEGKGRYAVMSQTQGAKEVNTGRKKKIPLLTKPLQLPYNTLNSSNNI